MLTVEMTSMPAASSSSTSCHRLAWRDPGRVGVGELVDQDQLGPAGQDGVDVHLLERRCRGARAVRRGTTSRPSSCSAVCDATVGLDETDDHVGATLLTALALVEHGERLADARRRTEVDAQRAPRPCGRLTAIGHQSILAVQRTACSRSGRVDRCDVVEGEVQLEHVDAGVAEDPERPIVDVVVDEAHDLVDGDPTRRRDTRRLQRALRSEMCGSRPEPDAVTASTGTSTSAPRPFSSR